MNDNNSYMVSVTTGADALEIFSSGGIDKIIDGIEAEVRSFAFDVGTSAGRKDVASLTEIEISEDHGKKLIAMVAKGKIRGLSIRY